MILPFEREFSAGPAGMLLLLQMADRSHRLLNECEQRSCRTRESPMQRRVNLGNPHRCPHDRTEKAANCPIDAAVVDGRSGFGPGVERR
jgi:hypothetical protein